MPKLKNPYNDLPSPIKSVYRKFKACTRCPLHTTKCNYVFYRGEAPCDILFIGEAPGRNEDKSGSPFVGRSGDLLEALIEDVKNQCVDFEYGITNIVSCIPLDEEGKIRQPSKEEADACRERFLMTLEKSAPKAIVLLGKVAKKYFKQPKESTQPVLELAHPAYILRKGGKNSLEYAKNVLYLRDFIMAHG